MEFKLQLVPLRISFPNFKPRNFSPADSKTTTDESSENKTSGSRSGYQISNLKFPIPHLRPSPNLWGCLPTHHATSPRPQQNEARCLSPVSLRNRGRLRRSRHPGTRPSGCRNARPHHRASTRNPQLLPPIAHLASRIFPSFTFQRSASIQPQTKAESETYGRFDTLL